MITEDSCWDVVVVGAGVAGGVAAVRLAQRGCRVLVVERSPWPREKVCGGCLSASALRVLGEMGIDSVLAGAAPLDGVVWHAGSQSLNLPVPRGAAILRTELDAALISRAVRLGCEFAPGCSASLLPARVDDSFRKLRLSGAGGDREVLAHLVIAADGISGSLLGSEPWAGWTVAPAPWMGVATTLSRGAGALDQARVHMHVGKSGYVGMVGVGEDKVHLAAALDPRGCQKAGGPAPLIGEILKSCRREIPAELEGAKFRGTGALTRRRLKLGGHRVLAVGDACGYVEPFTGEGMAWAAIGASEMIEMLQHPGLPWDDAFPARWRRRYLDIIGRQQRWCRGMRPTMHHPALAAAGIYMGSAIPGVARWIAQAVCEPRTKESIHVASRRLSSSNHSTGALSGHSWHRHGQSTVCPAGTGA